MNVGFSQLIFCIFFAEQLDFLSHCLELGNQLGIVIEVELVDWVIGAKSWICHWADLIRSSTNVTKVGNLTQKCFKTMATSRSDLLHCYVMMLYFNNKIISHSSPRFLEMSSIYCSSHEMPYESQRLLGNLTYTILYVLSFNSCPNFLMNSVFSGISILASSFKATISGIPKRFYSFNSSSIFDTSLTKTK